MHALTTPFTWFVRALQGVGQVVLAFMALTICYDAAMRYLFRAPTSWSLEVNTFLIIYLAVMVAADVQRKEAHISITFLADRLSWRGVQVLKAIIGAVGVAFCGIVAWRGGLMAAEAFRYGERVSSAFGTPMVLPYSMLPIGFGALALQFLVDVAHAVRGIVRGVPDAPPRPVEPGEF